jgi:hypothetical protein
MRLAKKILKKQLPGKKKQHSRSFREEHWQFLDQVRKDYLEDGEEPIREFDPTVPEDEIAAGLAQMFERAGLDPTAPGHWQFMLVAVVNAYGRNWTRVPTDWSPTEKIRFAQEVLDRRISGEKKVGRLKLIKRLQKLKPHEYPGDTEGLRVQLQDILAEWRALGEHASEEEKALLRIYDESY